MNEHERYQNMISAMLDGELSEREAEELSAHLAECDTCSAMCVAFAALSGAAEQVEVPATLHADVMARIDAVNAQKKQKKRGLLTRFRPTLTVAACLVVVAGAVIALRVGSHSARDAAEMSASYSMNSIAAAPEAAYPSDKALEESKIAADDAGMTAGAANGLTAAAPETPEEADNEAFADSMPSAAGAETANEALNADGHTRIEIRTVTEDSFTAVVLADPGGLFEPGWEITVVPETGERGAWTPGDLVWIEVDEWSSVSGHVTVGASRIEPLAETSEKGAEP